MPRSLADQVREWSTNQLANLLRARPDLAMPAPSDSSQLAARATSRASIARAVDLCDVIERAALEAVASLGGLTPPDLAPLIGTNVCAATNIVDRLCGLLLLWDDGAGLRAPRPLAERYAMPAGPPLSTIPGLLGELDDRQTALLRHLVEGELEGTSALGPQSSATGLVALGLLGVRGEGDPQTTQQQRLTVTLSTRQHFLDGRITNQPATAPTVLTTATEQSLIDRIGAGSATGLLRHVDTVIDAWSRRPPIALKSGDLSARDLKALGKALSIEPHESGFVLEVMHAARLIAVGELERDGQELQGWMPTTGYDEWARNSPGARWQHLATAWLTMPRRPGATGTRTSSGTVNALSEHVGHPHIAPLRRHLLEGWARTEVNTALASGTGIASLLAATRWLHPSWPHSEETALEVLTEAAWLGLVARDGMTQAARALLRGDDAASLLEPLLPDLVDHVLIQADLTAIAPGPLEPELALRLTEVADVDSRGGATVYRFTADSVRRGLDTGSSAEEIKAFLQTCSTTPVPQALDYLIDDVARRFGVLRLGSASVFLRSDDEVALTELAHDPRAASLGLRRIAPTVLVSSLEPSRVLSALRDLGAAPVLEATDGTVHVARPVAHRVAQGRLPQPTSVAQTEARIAATVAAIQSGDRAHAKRPADSVVHAPHDIIALLRRVLEANGEVVLAYAGPDGTVSQRVVRPLRLEGGRLTAYDERSDVQREFVIHRITAAAPAPELATRPVP